MESNKERNLSITNVIKQSSNIFLCECMADCRKTTTILDMFIKLINTQSSNCVIKALISSYKFENRLTKD